jgi:Holliday junction resolvase
MSDQLTIGRPPVAQWADTLPSAKAAKILEAFRKSRYGLGQFCKRLGYDVDQVHAAMRKHHGEAWDTLVASKGMKAENRYKAGRAFEYRVRDVLRPLGFFVQRSPGSKGAIDLLAVRDGLALMIQCKRGGACSPKEWNALFDLATAHGCTPILASAELGKGATFWLMTARKTGERGHRQPMEPYVVAPRPVVGSASPGAV